MNSTAWVREPSPDPQENPCSDKSNFRCLKEVVDQLPAAERALKKKIFQQPFFKSVNECWDDVRFWISWRIEVGILSTSARAYRSGHFAFANIYNLIALGKWVVGPRKEESADEEGIIFAYSALQELTRFIKSNIDRLIQHQDLSVLLFKALRRHYHLILIHTDTLESLAYPLPPIDAKRQRLLDMTHEIEQLCREWADEFATDLNPSFEFERQAYMTHRGYRFIKSARRNRDRSHLEEAHRRLNFADGINEINGYQRLELSAGVIDLHRALAVIEEGMVSPATIGGQPFTYSDYGKQIWGIWKAIEVSPAPEKAIYARWLGHRAKLAEVVNRQLIPRDDAVSIRSVLERARNILERTETTLTRSRKNVWWVTILFQTKVRFARLSLWARCLGVCDPELEDERKFDPIPFLGPEDVGLSAKSEIENATLNVERMARLDLVRISKTAVLLAECLNTFFTICIAESCVEPFLPRLRSLFLRCQGLRQTLTNRLNQRLEMKESIDEKSTLASSAECLARDRGIQRLTMVIDLVGPFVNRHKGDDE